MLCNKVSSGCEKSVKVWSLVTRSCLHTINCRDGFTNLAAPKIAVDQRFLLVSRPDSIEIYDSESVGGKGAIYFLSGLK